MVIQAGVGLYGSTHESFAVSKDSDEAWNRYPVDYQTKGAFNTSIANVHRFTYL